MNDIKKLEVFFPRSTKEEREGMLVKVESNKDLRSLNSEMEKVFDVLYPHDELTGKPENPITKLLSPNLSSLERDKILSTLQSMPASKRSNLSDKELISMLPSRYNQTLTDIDKLRDYFKEMIDSDTSDDVVDEVVQNDNSNNDEL